MSAVPLSRQFPVGRWVHVVMYAQVGLSTARSWVTFDGDLVAKKKLVAVPGIDNRLQAVAGVVRSTVEAEGALIDIDNVDAMIE